MDKKNIITIAIVLMVHDWELAFPMSAERNECWQFVRQWMKFIKGTDRVFECGDIMKVKLHGVFSSGDHFQDGVRATTSAVVRMEKIFPSKEGFLANWLKSWLFWPKKPNQAFRLTTESGSQFTVWLKDAAFLWCLVSTSSGCDDQSFLLVERTRMHIDSLWYLWYN